MLSSYYFFIQNWLIAMVSDESESAVIVDTHIGIKADLSGWRCLADIHPLCTRADPLLQKSGVPFSTWKVVKAVRLGQSAGRNLAENDLFAGALVFPGNLALRDIY